MQLGSLNLTEKRSTMSPGNFPYFGGQKIKVQGHESRESIAGVGLCTPVSAGYFQLYPTHETCQSG